MPDPAAYSPKRLFALDFLGGVVQCEWLTFDPLKMTPYGNALQTISVGYFLSAFVYPIRRAWLRLAIVLAGVAAYEFPLHLAGDYTMYGNWAVRFDMAIWRAILPAGNVFLDTHGWTRFSTTPMFLFFCACGMESTRLLQREDWSSWKKAGVLAAVGLAMCLFGVFLWKAIGIPLIKHIFGSSKFLVDDPDFVRLGNTEPPSAGGEESAGRFASRLFSTFQPCFNC